MSVYTPAASGESSTAPTSATRRPIRTTRAAYRAPRRGVIIGQWPGDEVLPLGRLPYDDGVRSDGRYARRR